MKIIMVDALVGNEYAALLSQALGSRGAEIDLIVPENREVSIPGNFNILRWSPAKGNRYGRITKVKKYVKYLIKLFKYAKKHKDAIIHYQFFRRKSEIFFYALLRLTGSNVVFTAHNVLPHDNKKIDIFLQDIVYKASKTIIVHSGYIKNKLTAHFKVNPSKIHVVPHGNFDFYVHDKMKNKEESRLALSLEKDDDVILFFGTLRENKGLGLLLEAFEKAAAENPRLKLVIAGNPQSDQQRSRYQQMMENNNFSSRIIYHARFIPVEDVSTYLTAADVVVLPYKNIDHSGVVHLAYSFGKPIIATRVGDFEESIEDQKSGYLLKENTSDELAGIIKKSFMQKDVLEKMGVYARHLNDTKYSWNSIALETLNLYKTA